MRDVHKLCKDVHNLRRQPEDVVEHCKTVEHTADDLQAVVESDDPVVARVGHDLPLVLHHDPGGGDGARHETYQFAQEAKLRARLHLLVASWRGAALWADVSLATLVPGPVTLHKPTHGWTRTLVI